MNSNYIYELLFTYLPYLAGGFFFAAILYRIAHSWKYLTAASIIHKIHILLGFLIVMIFPFTKFMHMVALPVRYLVTFFIHRK